MTGMGEQVSAAADHFIPAAPVAPFNTCRTIFVCYDNKRPWHEEGAAGRPPALSPPRRRERPARRPGTLGSHPPRRPGALGPEGSKGRKRRLWTSGSAAILLCLVLLGVGCMPKAAPTPTAPARVAVVLGAGAAKGFAHIGVLKVLEANNVPVHMVVGVSAGSLVGALYAYGYNPYQLQGLAMSLGKDDLVDLTIPDNGFVKGEKLQRYVNNAVRNTPIERFRIPFHAVATNIQTGEETVFGQGDAGLAVRASCSVPGVFQPPRFGGAVYVDGGVVAPVAVETARRYGADLVIAVDISGGVSATAPQGTIDTILKSIDIMYQRIAASHLRGADVVIRPNVGAISGADLSRRHEAILEGEKAATAAIPAVRQTLERYIREGRRP